MVGKDECQVGQRPTRCCVIVVCLLDADHVVFVQDRHSRPNAFDIYGQWRIDPLRFGGA